MILDIIRIILGILFAIFIPGYLLSLILFKKLKLIERVCIAVGLNIFIVVLLSFFLTAISQFTEITGITTKWVWLSLITLSLIFIIIIIATYKRTYQKGMFSIKKIFGFIVFYTGFFYLYSLIDRMLGRPRVTILMYHRISDNKHRTVLDSNVISASPKNFRKQMEHLAKNHKVITFDDLLDYYKKKKGLEKNSVIITFDDGYKDNYQHAYPILRKYRLPANMALTTGHIGGNELFWWDKIAYVINKTKLKKVSLYGLGEFPLENKELAITKIQEKVKKISDKKKNYFIDRLARKLGVKIPNARSLFLSWSEVRRMSRHNISFSAHTVNHPILTRLSFKEAKDEILRSKRKIQRETGEKVSVFTYPNGDKHDMSDKIDRFLKKSGFSFSLSTIYGANNPDAGLFRLKRISVENDDDMRLFKIKLSGLGRFFEPIYSRFL